MKYDYDIIDADEKRLAELGYKQELNRSLSLISTLGLAFTILSIPTSLIPFIYLGVGLGGPQAMLISWLVVSFLSVLVGLAMSEIASAYPTSGGLYFWAAKLAPKSWAPAASYFTGWFNFLGLWGLTAGTAYDVGEQFAATFHLFNIIDEKEVPNDDIRFRLLAYAISIFGLSIAAYMCTWSSRALNRIGQFFLYLNLIGLATLSLGVLFAPGEHVPLSELFGNFYNNSGFSNSYTWLISLLPAACTFTGYDSAGHMAEETKDAEESSPKAMMMAILLAIPLGFVTIWAFMSAIPVSEYAEAAENETVMIDIFMKFNGPIFGAMQVYLLILLSWSCTFSLIATHARMSYAFARDGGLPNWLYVLNEQKVPVRALLFTTGLSAIILLPTIYAPGLNVPVNSIGTVGTYISYVIPIGLKLLKGKNFEHGPFYLKPIGSFICTLIAFLWLLIASILLMLPTYNLTYSEEKYPTMAEYWSTFLEEFNFAPVMVGGTLIICLAMWIFRIRHWFEGPKCANLDEEEISSEFAEKSFSKAEKSLL